MDSNALPGQQMLGGNIIIQGGSFTQQNNPGFTSNDGQIQGSKGFKQLRKEVASAAFHNSAQRVDPPKCHPNTRKAVLRGIMDWIESWQQRTMLIMWLNGAAGAGKSAIAQSIAELCVEKGYAVASFFFFRTDPTRNSIKPLVATLAYQLIQAIPATRNIIIEAIEHNPLVFEQSFESQLQALISTPLRQVDHLSSQSSSKLPFIVIIDGVDECNNKDVQSNILRALSDISTPILFLIASRPENHLLMVFNSRKFRGIVKRLALDDKYLPDADIRLFLTEQFAEIQESHPFRHLLDASWPTNDLVDNIVEKSSGQFIYASVVMKFVSSPTHHPAERLEIARGLRPVRLDTPFAQLDALYHHIFTAVTDIENTLPVLAYSNLGKTTFIPRITEFLDLSPGSVQIALADLTSVIVCEGNVFDTHMRFLHASLPDFLLDSTRSQDYYVDPIKWHGEFAHRWFELQRSCGSLLSDLLPVVIVHLQNAEPTPQLHQDLLTFRPRIGQIDFEEHITDFLSAVRKLDFNDNSVAYDCQRRLMNKLVPRRDRGDSDTPIERPKSERPNHQGFRYFGSQRFIRWTKRLVCGIDTNL